MQKARDTARSHRKEDCKNFVWFSGHSKTETALHYTGACGYSSHMLATEKSQYLKAKQRMKITTALSYKISKLSFWFHFQIPILIATICFHPSFEKHVTKHSCTQNFCIKSPYNHVKDVWGITYIGLKMAFKTWFCNGCTLSKLKPVIYFTQIQSASQWQWNLTYN